MRNFGQRVYGAAAIILGLIGLWWKDFETIWQPVPDGMPGRSLLAVLAALLLIGGGLALQWRRTARFGSILIATLYLIFALLWLRRLAHSPDVLVTYSGTAEQLALVTAGWVVFASSGARRATWNTIRFGGLIFGTCLLFFGMAHFAYPTETAAMVPKFIPPNPTFWAAATGVAHIAGGFALLTGICALLAARMLTVMFVGFGLLVWLPQLFSNSHAHMAWGGNAVNLALVGAIWVMADAIKATDIPRGSRRNSLLAAFESGLRRFLDLRIADDQSVKRQTPAGEQ